MLFKDRIDAGRRLAALIPKPVGGQAIVLGLPRGGVPVAFEVAQALGAPLDVAVVRKVGAPGQPELAMGAVAEDGVFVANQDIVQEFGVRPEELDAAVRAKHAEVQERVRRFRDGGPPPALEGRTVILVDDGIATGATALAAIAWVRRQRPARVVLAVGVIAAGSLDRFRAAVDDLVYVQAPSHFGGVGAWYQDFRQVPDDEVVQLLRRARAPRGLPAQGSPLPAGKTTTESAQASAQVREVRIATVGATLEGTLSLPTDARGLVVFAHGSGSSRRSPRNQQVARALQARGLGTLLFDLLTAEEGAREDAGTMRRFDIPFLAGRLQAATQWVRGQPDLGGLPVGYFGASTGAAAALVAAARGPAGIQAVVSRGGRPDLAEESLARVGAPTLLLVGGHDGQVIDLNEQALAKLRCPKQLTIIPGATHLFEEPGTLERVAELAGDWFLAHFA